MAGALVKLTWWPGDSSWCGGPRTLASGGVVAVVAVPEIGGAHELSDAAMAMASRSKGLRGALNASSHGGRGKAEAVAL